MFRFRATPLKDFSSKCEVTLLRLFRKKISFSAIFDFGMADLSESHPKSSMLFRARDSHLPRQPHFAFSFSNIARWRLEITPYPAFDDFIKSFNRSYLNNYKKTQKNFMTYGATLSIIEGDWSEYAEPAYRLYSKVAGRHASPLYDLNFFKQIAKQEKYQLICAWLEGQMIAMVVSLEEGLVLHSICCGLDYEHSKKSYAYSYLHYALIKFGIEKKKFQIIDVGFSADNAKKVIGFKPVDSCLDISTRSKFFNWLLRKSSRYISGTITPQGHAKIHFKR